ncbi:MULTISPECIES: endonuclease/exonuclease/phosphatase family protein [unclassified Thermococcus]|uniref:endonuclease/exonuclease/phosphatase family protein n=1 Tax=unclassified Thermococcus TaxID=2627626 RepID=UPI001F10FA2D|nr:MULTISPECIES: endonuclease/exonuclease/phosphatase family protein [unclassified Thermococcus]
MSRKAGAALMAAYAVASLAFASAIALVESAKGSRGGVIGAAYLFLVATLALGAYVGMDIGLAFMDDNLEALILAASVIYALASYGGSTEVRLPNAKEIVGPLLGLAVVSVIVLALFNVGPTYVEAKKEVLIWSYNVHQGFGPYQGTFNGYELINLLKEQKPDIWAAQEVVGGMIGNGYQDIPLMISAYLGYAYEYKPAVEGTHGIAVFSHWHMKTESELNPESLGQARSAQKVTIDELELTLVNVHMGLNETERAMQAGELLKFAESEPVAHIIAGDTNVEPDEEAIAILTRNYYNSFEKRPPYTFKLGQHRHRKHRPHPAQEGLAGKGQRLRMPLRCGSFRPQADMGRHRATVRFLLFQPFLKIEPQLLNSKPDVSPPGEKYERDFIGSGVHCNRYYSSPRHETLGPQNPERRATKEREKL